MTSAECSMGLRSFLIHNNNNNDNESVAERNNENTVLCTKNNTEKQLIIKKNIISLNNNQYKAYNNFINNSSGVIENDLKQFNFSMNDQQNCRALCEDKKFIPSTESNNFSSSMEMVYDTGITINYDTKPEASEPCKNNKIIEEFRMKGKCEIETMSGKSFNDKTIESPYDSRKCAMLKDKKPYFCTNDLNIDGGASANSTFHLRRHIAGSAFNAKRTQYKADFSGMKASTSAVVQNKCYVTATAGNSFQNGYVNDENLLQRNGTKPGGRHLYHMHNHNHSVTPSTKLYPMEQSSPSPILNGGTEIENDNEHSTVVTPTKQNEEFYTALIKSSPTALPYAGKNGWRDTNSSHQPPSNGVLAQHEGKVSTFCLHTESTEPYCQKQLICQNSKGEHNCNRFKTNQSENVLNDLHAISNGGDPLAFEHEELRRRIVSTCNQDDEDEGEDGYHDEVGKSCGENNDAAIDAEVSEALFRAFSMPKNVRANMPTKYHVLSYIANTNTSLHIRRTGTELQVTDITGFPLMDVWLKTNCFRPTTWVLESYGTAVLLLTHDNTQKQLGSFWRRRRNTTVAQTQQQQQQQQKISTLSQPSTSAISQQQQQQNLLSHLPPIFNGLTPVTSTSVLHVQDPEGQTLGYFVVGDPFIIQNRERKPIARIVPSQSYAECSKTPSLLSSLPLPSGSASGYSQLLRTYQFLLDSNKHEIGRLEVNESHLSLMQLRFGNCHPSSNNVSTTTTTTDSGSSNPFNFSLKLLILASAIRLGAAISSGSATKKAGKLSNVCKSNTAVLATGTANPSENCCTIV